MCYVSEHRGYSRSEKTSRHSRRLCSKCYCFSRFGAIGEMRIMSLRSAFYSFRMTMYSGFSVILNRRSPCRQFPPQFYPFPVTTSMLFSRTKSSAFSFYSSRSLFCLSPRHRSWELLFFIFRLLQQAIANLESSVKLLGSASPILLELLQDLFRTSSFPKTSIEAGDELDPALQQRYESIQNQIFNSTQSQ